MFSLGSKSFSDLIRCVCQHWRLGSAYASWLCYTRGVIETFCSLAKFSLKLYAGIQWLSGRVLDSRPRVRTSPASLCSSLRKTHLSLLSTGPVPT